jgi:dual specificity tyrosine-phosphorylation-regulated kinase 2/3/4
MSALPSATAHRVATLKSRDSVSSMPPPASVPRSRPSTSGVGVTPRSPGTKTSDSSLRSTRHNLPPIAGSPSVGTLGHVSSSSHPPLSGPSRTSADTKETPTKIPRISSRTSTLHSPASTMKPSSLLSTRRASLVISNSNNGSFSGKSEVDVPPSPHASFVSDFGVLEPRETPTQKGHFSSTTKERTSLRLSPQSLSRPPRQIQPSLGSAKKTNPRDSSITNLRKSSAPSIASTSSMLPSDAPSLSSRLSVLSPSKSLKLLSPKVTLPVTRTTPSISNIVAPSTPGSSRQSLSTPSPAPSSADDDEALADEEMTQYIKRQQARKLASGVKKEELDEMLRFPEPIPPVSPSSPACEPISSWHALAL